MGGRAFGSSRRMSSIHRDAWRLFGIPIRVSPSWFFVAGFVAWSLARGYFPSRYPQFSVGVCWLLGVAAALLLFTCVVLHELGHSLVAKREGIGVACVTLFIFGGVSQITSHPARPSSELRVALAGPLVSLLIAWICSALLSAVRMPFAVAALLQYLAVANIALAVFNMLPGFPLDGGRVLRALLWAWSGSLRRATRIASSIGVLFGGALLTWGAWIMLRGIIGSGVWYLLLGSFLFRTARASYRSAA